MSYENSTGKFENLNFLLFLCFLSKMNIHLPKKTADKHAQIKGMRPSMRPFKKNAHRHKKKEKEFFHLPSKYLSCTRRKFFYRLQTLGFFSAKNILEKPLRNVMPGETESAEGNLFSRKKEFFDGAIFSSIAK